mmetsp:Transcript_26217/g.47259  ORF Transcript_26217/g.47259 Transcript_26217/m.47259 type:complete len:249 (-) Transcript_26217:423-1169(-)
MALELAVDHELVDQGEVRNPCKVVVDGGHPHDRSGQLEYGVPTAHVDQVDVPDARPELWIRAAEDLQLVTKCGSEHGMEELLGLMAVHKVIQPLFTAVPLDGRVPDGRHTQVPRGLQLVCGWVAKGAQAVPWAWLGAHADTPFCTLVLVLILILDLVLPVEGVRLPPCPGGGLQRCGLRLVSCEDSARHVIGLRAFGRRATLMSHGLVAAVLVRTDRGVCKGQKVAVSSASPCATKTGPSPVILLGLA